MTIQGVYVGNDPTAFSQAETWSGNAFSANTVFVGQSSWSDFDGSVGYEVNLWSGTAATKLWSVPLIVNGASLASAAQGAYDQHYLAAAKQLAASSPAGPIYIRTGWEFNGSWEPWASSGNDANYVEAYRDFVDVFRSVSNRFVFTWTPNIGGSSDPTVDYPGDKYVDIVGMDFYYNKQWDSTNPDVAWNYKVNEPYGLQWLESFAAQHGKPTAYPEWGINVDHADSYVQDAANWFSSHNVVYQSYWNSDADFSGKLSNNQYPSTSQAFLNDVAHSSLSGSQPLVEVDTRDTHGIKIYAQYYDGNVLAREEGYDAGSGSRTLIITHSLTQTVVTRYSLNGVITEQDTYDASGVRLSAVRVNPDGSSLVDTNDVNGDLVSLDGYDANGRHVWRNHYDTTGALIEQDGFDATGAETVILHAADGSVSNIESLDANGHLVWANTYVSGTLTEQDGYGVSGDKTAIMLNANGTVASMNYHDANGHPIWANTYVSGSLTEQDGYDASGGKTATMLNANGTAASVDHYDANGGHAWGNRYDQNGLLREQDGYNASGGLAITIVHQANGSTVSHYNFLGMVTEADVVNGQGVLQSSATWNIDESYTASGFSDTHAFEQESRDAQGALSSEVFFGSNGTDHVIGGGSFTVDSRGVGMVDVFNFLSDGSDVIDFSSGVFLNVGDVVQHATQVGPDVRIDIDVHDVITIHNASISALGSGDILFH